MKPEHEEPIDREAWRRRLGDAGAPTEATDLVIRAEARRVVTPRTSRWWLPASLAAAMVLAFFLAEWQIEDERMNPLIDESQVPRLPAPAADVTAAPATEESDAAAAGDSAYLAVPPAERESAEGVAALPAVEMPAPDRAAESAAVPMPEEKAANAAPPPPDQPTAREDQETAPPTGITGRIASPPAPQTNTVTGTSARQKADAAERTPEAWYAEIEALRAEGRDAEADAELEKLEAAHPGWLARRRESEP